MNYVFTFIKVMDSMKNLGTNLHDKTLFPTFLGMNSKISWNNRLRLNIMSNGSFNTKLSFSVGPWGFVQYDP